MMGALPYLPPLKAVLHPVVALVPLTRAPGRGVCLGAGAPYASSLLRRAAFADRCRCAGWPLGMAAPCARSCGGAPLARTLKQGQMRVWEKCEPHLLSEHNQHAGASCVFPVCEDAIAWAYEESIYHIWSVGYLRQCRGANYVQMWKHLQPAAECTRRKGAEASKCCEWNDSACATDRHDRS